MPSLCARAKRSSSGSRIMRPSSARISHSAPTGSSPASAHRSGTASVWPARRSTPPGTARSGNTWPGRSRSWGRVRGSASTRSVRARSNAEVPVVVPRFASTDSVNGVPKRAVLRSTMGLRPSRSACPGAMGAHRMPRPCLSAKLTRAGVVFSAAHTRSPSFSRSASSTTITMPPARMRRTAASTVRNTPRPAARDPFRRDAGAPARARGARRARRRGAARFMSSSAPCHPRPAAAPGSARSGPLRGSRAFLPRTPPPPSPPGCAG